MSEVHVVIPARYASERFPGKPLAEICGRPMVMHVHDRAREAGVGDITIATDDPRIQDVCQMSGASTVMTRDDHQSGTDRIAEVADQRAWADDDVVINVQGDEPDLPASCIEQLASAMADGHDMATLATPIENAKQFKDPSIVKVICDAAGDAMYFSRAPIPVDRDEGGFATAYRHIGLYAYTVRTLRTLSQEPVCGPERSERLEQLRALYHGVRIRVIKAIDVPPPGVDTVEELKRAAKRMGQ
jgi:3-deoxy-manno-octulosonate cytidylyltransferase (CMP-KDO synthetase)